MQSRAEQRCERGECASASGKGWEWEGRKVKGRVRGGMKGMGGWRSKDEKAEREREKGRGHQVSTLSTRRAAGHASLGAGNGGACTSMGQWGGGGRSGKGAWYCRL